jgi:hypothetical protein
MKEPGLDNRHRDKNPPKVERFSRNVVKRSTRTYRNQLPSSRLTRSLALCERKQAKQAWRPSEERPSVYALERRLLPCCSAFRGPR